MIFTVPISLYFYCTVLAYVAAAYYAFMNMLWANVAPA